MAFPDKSKNGKGGSKDASESPDASESESSSSSESAESESSPLEKWAKAQKK